MSWYSIKQIGQTKPRIRFQLAGFLSDYYYTSYISFDLLMIRIALIIRHPYSNARLTCRHTNRPLTLGTRSSLAFGNPLRELPRGEDHVSCYLISSIHTRKTIQIKWAGEEAEYNFQFIFWSSLLSSNRGVSWSWLISAFKISPINWWTSFFIAINKPIMLIETFSALSPPEELPHPKDMS